MAFKQTEFGSEGFPEHARDLMAPMSVYAPCLQRGFVLCVFCGDSVPCRVEGGIWKYRCGCGAEGVYFPDSVRGKHIRSATGRSNASDGKMSP